MRAVRWILAAALLAAPVRAATLNAVLEAEVVTLDPHFTTAYISRTFGYLVFDTLFAMDTAGAIKPQMVERYETSADGMTWTFVLRDGLAFHDGSPVTAEDCVLSLKRWGSRDGFGRRLFAATGSLEAVDAKTIRLVLKEKFGLVLDALGKPSSVTPFILPARLARTPGTEKITEIVGSGPFKFRQDLYRPGDSMQVDRNAAYVPRREPADFMSGGKVPKLDSIVLRVIPDGATAASALMRGEIDYIQYAPFDLIPRLEKAPGVHVQGFTGAHMFMGWFRVNQASKPFDDPAIRRVLWKMVDQSEALAALGIDAKYTIPGCQSFWMCDTPLSTKAGAEAAANPSIAAAQAALKATKYAGEKVTILQATDIEALKVSSELLADMMRRVGFTVELVATDWGTLLSRRANKEGWSAFGVTAQGFDLASPLTHFYVANNCVDYAGWQCDAKVTTLFPQFIAAQTLDERKRIAAELQEAVYESTPAVMWGQFAQPAAWRSTLKGVIPSSIPVFWNMEKP